MLRNSNNNYIAIHYTVWSAHNYFFPCQIQCVNYTCRTWHNYNYTCTRHVITCAESAFAKCKNIMCFIWKFVIHVEDILIRFQEGKGYGTEYRLLSLACEFKVNTDSEFICPWGTNTCSTHAFIINKLQVRMTGKSICTEGL